MFFFTNDSSTSKMNNDGLKKIYSEKAERKEEED